MKFKYIVTHHITNPAQTSVVVFDSYLDARRWINGIYVKSADKWVFGIDKGSLRKYPVQPKHVVQKLLQTSNPKFTFPIITCTSGKGRETITIFISKV